MSFIVRKIAGLGARTIAACLAALTAAILIFAAPEVGIAGGFSAIVLGGVSAVLMHPHTRA